jgi:membrane fusion protein, multidrug efflux system
MAAVTTGLSSCSKAQDNAKAAAPSAGGKPGASPAAPGGGGPPLPVTARILSPQRMDNRITSTGTILADEEVDIRSEIQGKIRRIAFKEGSRVAKGALLLKLDDAELQAQLLKVRSQGKLAEVDEYRMRMQFKVEAASQKEYDQALNGLNIVKAEEQLLRAQLEKTELRAPFSGTIGLKYVSEGGYVDPSTRITVLQAVNPVKVDFSVPGKYAGWIHTGQMIRFTVQGSEEVREGKVYAVESRIDEGTRNLQLRASCANADGKILPGAFASVEILMETIEAALLIPSEALTSDIKGPKVFLYAAGKALPRPVAAGLRTDSTVQITGGLKEGDTVITSGIVQLRPGAPVILSGFN